MGNKSFLVYFDLLRQTEKLNNEQMGKLFRMMIKYAETGELEEVEDEKIEMALNFVTVQIREDQSKYLKVCEKNRENANSKKRKTENPD